MHTIEDGLREEEGYEHAAYPDPVSHGDPWTIGIGHTGPEVHQGLTWTDDQIEAAFQQDVGEAWALCRRNFPWLSDLNDARQAVLVDMAFQMGNKLLGFHRMLAAVRDERFETAVAEMLASAWAHETPKRAARLARQMQTGEWQY